MSYAPLYHLDKEISTEAIENAKRAREYINSEQGQKDIEGILNRANETRKRLQKARKIPPDRFMDIMFTPMTDLKKLYR